jgi:AcrR family transcriptional regulator
MAPSASPSSSAREHILATAAELFYRDGYRAVGVDTISERSGVAKMTLYRHFPSKDELIVAHLAEANRRFWEWFEDAIAGRESPREKLLALFEATGTLASSPECLGCTFQAAASEFPEAGHAAHGVAAAHKRAVVARLVELAGAAGAADSDELARELLLLMDGAFASARMFARNGPATCVARAAEAVIDRELAASASTSKLSAG